MKEANIKGLKNQKYWRKQGEVVVKRIEELEMRNAKLVEALKYLEQEVRGLQTLKTPPRNPWVIADEIKSLIKEASDE